MFLPQIKQAEADDYGKDYERSHSLLAAVHKPSIAANDRPVLVV
jgi:hypothetical protein